MLATKVNAAAAPRGLVIFMSESPGLVGGPNRPIRVAMTRHIAISYNDRDNIATDSGRAVVDVTAEFDRIDRQPTQRKNNDET